MVHHPDPHSRGTTARCAPPTAEKPVALTIGRCLLRLPITDVHDLAWSQTAVVAPRLRQACHNTVIPRYPE